MKSETPNETKIRKNTYEIDKAEAAERLRKIIPLLKRLYPAATTALRFRNPLELLIATILSAQCTDKQVNIVTARLFDKYKTAEDWANVPIVRLQSDIKTTGFFRNKAKNIKAVCRRIANDFDGKVPETLDQLTSMPGIGRKTANVVLGNAFGKPAIACDTHVIRLSRRFGLSEKTDAVKLEFDLMKIVPRKDWTAFSHLLIHHGRNICRARKPACDLCRIAKHCPSAHNTQLW